MSPWKFPPKTLFLSVSLHLPAGISPTISVLMLLVSVPSALEYLLSLCTPPSVIFEYALLSMYHPCLLLNKQTNKKSFPCTGAKMVKLPELEMYIKYAWFVGRESPVNWANVLRSQGQPWQCHALNIKKLRCTSLVCDKWWRSCWMWQCFGMQLVNPG